MTYTAEDDFADVEELFRCAANVADQEDRQRVRCEIITRCMPLADHVAYRYFGRGEQSDDLVQVARLGLIKAVDRYRPDAGRFLAFAVPTILGEIRRHFRDNSWTMHVPRRLKDSHMRVRAAVGVLSQRLGRAPTANELAAELGLDCEQVAESIDVGYAYRPCSLDAALPSRADGEPTGLHKYGAEDARYSSIEDAVAVAELVSHVSERERALLRMRFCECLTQAQIADRLGVSQVQVSRLLAMTLDRLRAHFRPDAPSSATAASETVTSRSPSSSPHEQLRFALATVGTGSAAGA